MAQVVIIGGGTAGLPAAFEVAESARAGERITLVADRPAFRAAPATPWISIHESASFDILASLQRKGIGFSSAGARRLRPEANQLELGDGSVLDYDVLVIAAGPQPAFDAIPGLGPQGYTQSLCHADHLPGCVRAWEAFLAAPGPIVLGAVQGATCFVPAYESALRMDRELRERGLRERAPITFVTPEPHIGHLGVGDIEDSRPRLERALREHDIAWIANARVERVESGTLRLTGCEAEGTPSRQHALPFAYAMLMPPFRGIDAVAGIEGLANGQGFIFVDEFLRNPRFRNIFAAGITVASAASAGAVGHKSAFMIDEMVSAVVRNVRGRLDGREPDAKPAWSAVRLADLGAAGLAFLADPEAVHDAHKGKRAANWVHLSRCSACDVGGATPRSLL